MSSNTITVVTGLPRSGTSLMMQMLMAGGMPVLIDNVRLPDESNPRGYLEFEPVKRLATDATWLPLAQGRAVKVIHMLLSSLPMDGSFEYRILFMQRPIEEVLASQEAMLRRLARPSADPSILRRAFDSQIERTMRWLATHPSVPVLHIKYHQLVSHPEAVAEGVRVFLGGRLDVQNMAQAVDPTLHRQIVSGSRILS